MDHILVYITAPDIKCARMVGKSLVEQRLAACANILPGMESLYWWDNEVQTAQEVVLLVKSTGAAFERLKEYVLSLHPYEVPCIVAIKIEAGHNPFLGWIAAQISPRESALENG